MQKIKFKLSKEDYTCVYKLLESAVIGWKAKNITEKAAREVLLKVLVRMASKIFVLKYANNTLSFTIVEAWAFYTLIQIYLRFNNDLSVYNNMLLQEMVNEIHRATI